MIGDPADRPVWVRRLNAMAHGVGGAAALVRLDADELIQEAQDATGLHDFGPEEWEQPFRLLVSALDTEARLHVVGRLMCRHDALRHLCTRLILRDTVVRDPSILEREVVAPVFITGPARSGTSILQELLAEDPQLRGPRAYEMAHPVPPPDVSAEDTRAWAECEFDLWGDVSPEFNAVHELTSSLPEECLWLMAPMFDIGFWSTCTDIPSFMAARAVADPEPLYRYHRMFLQVLQGPHQDRTWVLKSPVHLGRLAALFAVYPDARVIRTHRDPVKTVPSGVSTLAHGRWIRSDVYDPKALGAMAGVGFQMMLNSAAAQPPPGLVAELHYQDLLADPVAAIRAAYGSLGLDLTDGFAARIVAYLEQRPQAKHGHHRYTAEDFGLDPAELRERFRPYTSAFGVALEG